MRELLKVLKVEKEGMIVRLNEGEIGNDNESIQDFVGGHYRIVPALPPHYRKSIFLVCKEEDIGKLPPVIGFKRDNHLVDVICGQSFFMASEGVEYASLTENDIALLRQAYSQHATVDKNGMPYHIICVDLQA